MRRAVTWAELGEDTREAQAAFDRPMFLGPLGRDCRPPEARRGERRSQRRRASLTCCLPDGLSHQPSAGTGTVMRPATLEDYARQAGFAAVEELPIENDFFRFYRLV